MLKKDKVRSDARRINILLKKYKKLIGKYYETSDFKEPVLFLMRNDRRVEFFENATRGEFMYKHSNDDQRKITLNPQYLHNFEYGRRTFKGYICHEDYPTPLPENPVVTAELFNIAQEKTLNDIRKFHEKEIRAKGDLIWKIAIGIAVIIGVMALAQMVVPGFNVFGGGGATEKVVEGATTILP